METRHGLIPELHYIDHYIVPSVPYPGAMLSTGCALLDQLPGLHVKTF